MPIMRLLSARKGEGDNKGSELLEMTDQNPSLREEHLLTSLPVSLGASLPLAASVELVADAETARFVKAVQSLHDALCLQRPDQHLH